MTEYGSIHSLDAFYITHFTAGTLECLHSQFQFEDISVLFQDFLVY